MALVWWCQDGGWLLDNTNSASNRHRSSRLSSMGHTDKCQTELRTRTNKQQESESKRERAKEKLQQGGISSKLAAADSVTEGADSTERVQLCAKFSAQLWAQHTSTHFPPRLSRAAIITSQACVCDSVGGRAIDPEQRCLSSALIRRMA